MILTVNPRHLPITAWNSSTAKEFIFIISSPRILLDSKEIKPVHPKGNQPWIFIGRTDAEAEAPILWPHDAKNWPTGKDPDAGKDWRREEKGVTEDEMVGWHHWLNRPEFEQTPRDSEGQRSLVCCSPWGCKESDTTEWLNNKGDLSKVWALVIELYRYRFINCDTWTTLTQENRRDWASSIWKLSMLSWQVFC